MTWFRKKGAGGPTQRIEGPKKRKGAGFQKVGQSDPPVGVLFVEQTPMGELATRLKDLIKRLEPILGFSTGLLPISFFMGRTEMWEMGLCNLRAKG